MTGQGWVTGGDIKSRPYTTKESRDEYDRIFGHNNPPKQIPPNPEPINGDRPQEQH